MKLTRILALTLTALVTLSAVAQQHDKPGCNIWQNGGSPKCPAKDCPEGCGIFDDRLTSVDVLTHPLKLRGL